jgi:ubiquinone/menaquinone biosynthesis C-methylase UbiE
MGCGTGELTQRLQELVGEEGLVMGVDASESMASIHSAQFFSMLI